MPATAKTYQYKVYNTAGTYVGNWDTDVISEFSMAEELNGAGGQVEVHLARAADSFGEGVTVDFNYQVKIYCVDGDQPNGVIVFIGFISNYTPVFGAEQVIVTLMGYGAELDNFIIDNAAPTTPFYTTPGSLHNSATYFGGANYAAESLYMSSGKNITKITAQIGWDNVLFTIPPASTGNLQCGIFADNLGKPGAQIGSWVSADTIPLGGAALVTFDFSASPIPANTGLRYWAVFRDATASNTGYIILESLGDNDAANSQFRSANSGSTWTEYVGNDLYMNVYDDINDTTVAYASQDPGTIMRAIIDRYRAQGGTLNYDASTIELTGTTVSYTFNTNTVLEGIKTCLTLAPVDWYFYIDQTTNKVHFHKKTSSAARTFVLGKDILDVSPRKTIENMINIVYFTGGGTPALFRKYQNAASVALYGHKVIRYVDQRVTSATTASTISNTLLAQRNAPELQLEFELLDNNVLSPGGYDIELVTLGETIGLRGFGGSGSSLWDVGMWDVDYWDYNIKDLGTLVLQIVRLERLPGSIKVFCSTVPPDVTKRMEDINRNLSASQTVANPSVAS